MADTKENHIPTPTLADKSAKRDSNKQQSANVTWLGDGSDAEENTWNGVTFKKGEAVEVKDQDMIETAKANRFYKVDGDNSETVEDKPEPQPIPGRVDDQVVNAAFAPQEVLTARRQESIQRAAAEAEDEERRNPTENGKSRTFAERVPPNKNKPATVDRRTGEFR